MSGPPRADIHAKDVGSVALMPGDHPGVKPVLRVGEGQRVALGETLFEDRNDPQVRFTSPGAGTVTAIHRGAKRSLRGVVVTLAGTAEVEFEPVPRERIGSLSRELVRQRLLDAGLCVTLNSDDPAYFGGYVNDNFVAAFEALPQLNAADAYALAHNSFVASFAPAAEKARWQAQLDEVFAQHLS